MAKLTSMKRYGKNSRSVTEAHSSMSGIGFMTLGEGAIQFGLDGEDRNYKMTLTAGEVAEFAMAAHRYAAKYPGNFRISLTVGRQADNKFHVLYKAMGISLRRNFDTEADAMAWAMKTDVLNLRLYRYPSDILWGEDYDADFGMKVIWAEDDLDAFLGASRNGVSGPVHLQAWRNGKWQILPEPTSLWSVVDTKRHRDGKCIIPFYGNSEDECSAWLGRHHDQKRVLAGEFHIDPPADLGEF